MKILRAAAVLLAFSFATASADWVITLDVDSSQGKMQMETRVKGRRARMDMDSPLGKMSTLVDAATGNSTQLIHSQKAAIPISGSAMKKQAEMMKKLSGGSADGAPVKPQPTGKKEKVGEWDCEIYTWKSGEIESRMWIASNVSNGAALKQALGVIKSSALGGGQAGPDEADLPGPAVKTETKSRNSTTTVTLTSLKEEELDSSIFEVPADYMPLQLPGGGFPGALPK